ncbi:Wzy polymerase domain-containing protein [Acidovorax sp.]|uniref:Wzy polymerase domain-containing protein n=1 Tax=Acidovorax sp. TaxID=1872122 RepID=UPI00391F2302
MLLDAVAAPLFVMAVSLPFVFGYTAPPIANFWPLTFAWACGVVAMLCFVRCTRALGGVQGRWVMARQVAAAMLLAALVGGLIGLAQYVAGDLGWSPWVQASVPGQAMGNLRQRNQQASLLSLGVWALLWMVMQTRARSDAGASAASAPPSPAAGLRVWRSWLVGGLIIGGLAFLAVASAATTSRTGAVQWLLIVGLVMLWRARGGAADLGLSVAGVGLYVLAAWWLPGLLQEWTGATAESLVTRLHGEASGCTSRRVLWANVIHLIAQKPWLGWGWGELDYAHYITQFPGARFCVLLDNAHNLPLHLAVELGLPAAGLLCLVALVWVMRAKPWRETDPARQLAWGVLAIVGFHSLLEFPLWYGPFQVITLLAVALLWQWPLPAWAATRAAQAAGVAGLVCAAAVALAAVWDYYRVSLLYRPAHLRPAAYQQDTAAKVSDAVFFSDQADFAWLSTTTLTQETAPRRYAVALSLLHFSPEPRVIEALIGSAELLGQDGEAAFHRERYRIAYPADFQRWAGARALAASVPDY